LKTHALWLSPTSHLGAIALPRWVSVVGVGLEVAIALALMLAWRLRLVQGLALVLFTCFAVIAGWLAWSGAASCSCFGQLVVPPWATLILDLVMVGTLAWNLRWMPQQTSSAGSGRHWRPSVAVIGGLALASVLFLHRPDLGASIQQATIIAGSRLEVQAAERIDTGDWIVVCYRSDCPHCTASIGEWLEWAVLDQENNGRRWAFLNVDDPGTDRDLLDRFPEAKAVRWRRPMPFLTTPLVLALRAGVVTRTSQSVEEFFAALPADGLVSQTVSDLDHRSP
jgi:hypothetical protein